MTGDRPDQANAPQRVVAPAPAPGALPISPVGPDSCEEFDIRIDRDGTWFYHGSPITRKPLVKLFSTVLRRDEAGDFWLETLAEKGRIRVEDAPFVAVELTVRGSGSTQELQFRTNLDDVVTAGEGHHIRVTTDSETDEPRPYIHVRRGLEALIARPVFYQLVELGTEERMSDGATNFGVRSGGVFFPLGKTE